MSTKRNLLKRLEEFEKKLLPGDMTDFVFIKETSDAGVFEVSHSVYFGKGGSKKDYSESWTVKADNAQEVADRYEQPAGCKEVLKFIINYK